jgi:TRAP-type mannitol/chloroaromatic compound transport system substrate-binding protein
MRRRISSWSGIALAALALVLAGAIPAFAQQSFKLKIQASWPAGQTLFENLKLFADRVDKLSAGRLKVEALPDGAVVGAFEVLDATSRGVVDGGHTAPAYWIGRSRAAIPLSHGPLFGMDYIDMFGWYHHGGGIDLLNEWYRDILKANVVSFPILTAGPQALGWFKKPIRSWADFKGVKYRIYGLGNEVFKEAGMSVVLLPGGEILPAGERGVIDGAEWVGGVEDLRFGFHNIWKYHVTPGMHEQVTFGDLLINKDVWNKLPADLQEIVKAAVTDTLFKWWTAWQRQNADAYKEMVEKHKVHVQKTPDDIQMTFLKTADRLYAKWAEEDKTGFFRKVIESQKRYAGQVVPYRRSTWPEYRFLADYYWKDRVFLK